MDPFVGCERGKGVGVHEEPSTESARLMTAVIIPVTLEAVVGSGETEV